MIDLGSDDCRRMHGLMWKYRGAPMDLANTVLVRVTECERVRGCSRSTSEILNQPCRVRLLSNPGLIGRSAPFSTSRSHV
jgi:hypothetical protein